MPLEKKKRLAITFEEKEQILNRLKQGERVSAVAKSLNMNEATIRTIKRNEEKIRKYISMGRSGKTRSLCAGDINVMRAEEALAIWIKDCINKRVPLDGNTIRQKALKIYHHIDGGHQTTAEQQTQSFIASKGWLDKFKQRFALHNIKFQGESASADAEAASKFTAEFKKIVEDGSYMADQIFNADETGLYWKKLPSRTYIYKSIKSVPGFKVSKERITLLLCSNASGDFCMKPMLINKSLKPRALKNCDNSQLPVYWRANKKAWMTANMFTDWFHNCFVPDVENYLLKKNLSFKALLLLDNAPGHPEELHHPNVKVVFLPPNTTSLIQPLDQGVISTFKTYYIRISFQSILENIESGENKTLTQAWKEFSILDCIKTVSSAINDLKSSTLNACWKSLFPDVVCEDNYVPRKEIEYDRIINVAHSLRGEGFDDMSSEDIDELLFENPLDEEDLLDILSKSTSNLVTAEEEESYEDASTQKLSMTDVQHGLNMAKELEAYFAERDPCIARREIFAAELNKCLNPYKKLIAELNVPSCSTEKQQDEEVSSDEDPLPPKRRNIKLTAFLDNTSDSDYLD